jgi:hypothetical protein
MHRLHAYLTCRDVAVPHRRRFTTSALLLALGMLLATTVHAGLDAQGQREVAALLAFVGQSPCTFIRNGKSYSAADAKSHLETKLNYLVHRDQVNSAEEFIDRAGTKSSLSGLPYRVNCAGEERLSADWLKEELRVLRESPP